MNGRDIFFYAFGVHNYILKYQHAWTNIILKKKSVINVHNIIFNIHINCYNMLFITSINNIILWVVTLNIVFCTIIAVYI